MTFGAVIEPLLVMPPVKVDTRSTTMPVPDAEITPLLMMLPEKVEMNWDRTRPAAALIVPPLSLTISPVNLLTRVTPIPTPLGAVIEPLLVIPPVKVDTRLTTMPLVPEIEPLFRMLPTKLPTPPLLLLLNGLVPTRMPIPLPNLPPAAVIVPLLVIPPVKVVASTRMPVKDAEIVPLLMMLPEKIELHAHRLMPVAALIAPPLSLTMLPEKFLTLLMLIPAPVVAVIVPLLVMSPVKVDTLTIEIPVLA
jgi:hypothetical protein